jgi:hypothetical protein
MINTSNIVVFIIFFCLSILYVFRFFKIKSINNLFISFNAKL